jgi:hypothetical protein
VTKKARWTLLVYMAADNNLARQGRRDLEEMLAVGASSDVHVVVLFALQSAITIDRVP